jgi:zinc transporter ZupT
MAVAWLLTLLALGGIVAGLLLGQSRALSSHLGAAGGGLLFGIALFWVIPEIAGTAKWGGAFALALAACGLLAGLDQLLMHTGHSPRHGIIGPLLAAAAVHSFLDGWSVRALSGQPLTNVAVPVGLAFHKVPEGLALGWISRRTLSSHWKAAVAGGSVEFLTVVGAFIEPRANASGAATFGAWWTASVLAVIAGSFLFLGLHALLPNWRRPGVVAAFVVTLLLVGVIRE